MVLSSRSELGGCSTTAVQSRKPTYTVQDKYDHEWLFEFRGYLLNLFTNRVGESDRLPDILRNRSQLAVNASEKMV